MTNSDELSHAFASGEGAHHKSDTPLCLSESLLCIFIFAHPRGLQLGGSGAVLGVLALCRAGGHPLYLSWASAQENLCATGPAWLQDLLGVGVATRLWFEVDSIVPSEVWTCPCPGGFTSSELRGDATNAIYRVLKKVHSEPSNSKAC